MFKPAQTVLVYDAPVSTTLVGLVAAEGSLKDMYDLSPNNFTYGYWHQNRSFVKNAGSHNVGFIDGHAKIYKPGIVRVGWFRIRNLWVDGD